MPLHVSGFCEQKFLWTLLFANYSSFTKIAKICLAKISRYTVAALYAGVAAILKLYMYVLALITEQG